MRVEWPGAGGWGDPLDRDPNRVLHDISEGKIGLQRAQDAYGVVVDESMRRVDLGATADLREKLRSQR